MKKLLLTLILVLTTTFSLKAENYIDSTVITIPFTTDNTITSISVNVPSRIIFYSIDEHPSGEILVKFNQTTNKLDLSTCVSYELKDGVLFFNLKNYTIEEMNNFNENAVKFYIPDTYFDKIQTRRGFILEKSKIKKNDSGNSTI